MSDPEIGRFYPDDAGAGERRSRAELLFFTLELNRIDDAALEAKLAEPGAGALRAVAARHARLPAASAQRRAREAAAREIGRRARRLDAALRRDHGGAALSASTARSLTERRGAASPLRPRSARCARRRRRRWARCSARMCGSSPSSPTRSPRTRRSRTAGAASRGPISSRNLGELRRGRGGGRAHRRRARRLSAPLASLLPPEGEMVRRRAAALTGTATRRCPTRTTAAFRGARRERTVLDAYAAFSPELAAIGRRFFEHPWIDAPVRPGKAPGAFAHPTVPSAHPYLLLNYQGKHARRDDAGARAGPRRPSGAGRRRRAI